MLINNVFLILFAALALLFIILYFFEVYKKNRSINYLKNELHVISEKVGKTAFGLLNQNIKIEENNALKSFNINNEINELKKNFNQLTSEPLLRLCYVGTDAWIEGSRCAEVVAEKINKKGKVAVLVTSNLGALIMLQRYRSFAATIADKYPEISLIETFEAKTDQERAAGFIERISKEADAVYITGNSAAAGAVLGLKRSGMSGRVIVLCHDIEVSIADGIKSGAISASLVCSTIAQGRDSTLHLYNHIVSGWSPKQPRIYQPLTLVDRSNIDEYWSFEEKQLIEFIKQNKGSIKPAEKSRNRVRILAFTEDWNNAFKQMKSGIDIAKDVLKDCNAEVVIYNINQLKCSNEELINKLNTIFENESKFGYQGIVTYVGSQNIVSLLNNEQKKGIKIATYNSEPLGLRSMILWLLQSSLELENFGNEYLTGHKEIDIGVKEGVFTLNNMVQNIIRSEKSVDEGVESVNNLNTLIEKTAVEDEKQMKIISSSSKISSDLIEMVNFFNNKIESLKIIIENVDSTEKKILALKEHGDKILSIIEIIDAISKQTNLLSINASIESSKTGDSGKGFGIISKEIRALSEKTALSTKDVSHIIKEMISSIDESSTSISFAKKNVDEQVHSISDAIISLNDFSKKLTETMSILEKTVLENGEAIISMKNKGESLRKVINESKEISSSNSDSIESLSSMFSEISMQFNQLNLKTYELNEIIKILYNTASQFNT